MTIEKGNIVVLDYTGTFEDGTVFDASEKHGKPLEFEAGAGLVVKGFDDAVIGMDKGEEKKFTLEPKDAYGDYRDDLKKEIPREQLPQDQEPQVGMMVGVGMPNGQQFPASIVAVEEKHVVLDLNHPLAGKKLTFDIKIVDVKDAPAKEDTEGKEE